MNLQESMQSAEGAVLHSSTSIVLSSILQDVVNGMIPYMIASTALVLVDLIFGIKAARHRKEEIRWPRAIRRTISKTLEYVCWVMLGTTLSMACNYPPLAWILPSLAWGVEVWSIYKNWAESRDKKLWIKNLFSLAMQLIGAKVGVDLSDIKIMEDNDEN